MRVEVSAIKALESFLDAAPDITRQAASLAMNTVLPRKGMTAYKKAIRQEVGFPGGYLEEADKFGVTTFAKPNDLTAKITARQRPTSLARFASGTPGQEGVTIRGVGKPGSSTRLKRAFLVRLNQGTQLTGDNYNLGVAVRVPGGLTRGKRETGRMVTLSKDVFLLYGPSVDQVFRSVSVTETPLVLNDIETEFYRQFGRLS